MEKITYQISELTKSFTNSISNGFDIYETTVCIFFIAAVVLIIWIISWMSIKISSSLFDTIKVLIGSLEDVLNSLFSGVKSALRKLSDLGKQED